MWNAGRNRCLSSPDADKDQMVTKSTTDHTQPTGVDSVVVGLYLSVRTREPEPSDPRLGVRVTSSFDPGAVFRTVYERFLDVRTLFKHGQHSYTTISDTAFVQKKSVFPYANCFWFEPHILRSHDIRTWWSLKTSTSNPRFMRVRHRSTGCLHIAAFGSLGNRELMFQWYSSLSLDPR